MPATIWYQFFLPHLDRVCHSVQELDDEQRRDLSLDDGQEEDLAPEDADEVVVRSLQHRGHILGLRGFLLGLEEVIAHAAADDTLPVFLKEDVPRVIDKEQAVDHLSCNRGGLLVLALTQDTQKWLWWIQKPANIFDLWQYKK